MPFVQASPSVAVDTPSGVQTSTFAATPSASNAIIVVVTGIVQLTSAPYTVTDNYGNTYTLDSSEHAVYGSGYSAWACIYRSGPTITTGPGFTVSVIPASAALGSVDFVAMEYSYISTPLDKTNGATATSTAPAAGATGTLSTVPEIVITAFSAPGVNTGASPTTTAPSGYTTRYSDLSVRVGACADKRVLATTTQNPTWTISSSVLWVACVASYKDTAALPSAPAITLAIGATDVVSVTAAATAGDFAIDHYLLLESSSPNAETTTGVTATPGSYPLAFTGQTRPTAGNAKYYVVQTVDSNGGVSPNSIEVSDRVTGVVASGLTYPHISGAGYGAGGAGLAGLSQIGYTVFDKIGAVLQAHTYTSVVELPNPTNNQSGVTGIYLVSVPIDYNWSGGILWDAPTGGAAYFELFDTRPLPVYVSDAVATASSTTSFTGSSALSSTDSWYVKSFLCFTSGSNKGIAKEISAYTGSTRTFTTAAFPTTPTAADAFVIIGQGA